MQYPVLIGSYNLNPNDAKDIDLISDKIYEFKNKTYIIDYFLINDGNLSKKLIYDYCNDNKEEMEIIKLMDEIDVIVCPIQLLYVLKKSYIHRIINYTDNQSDNIDIWYKNVKQYLELRNHKDNYSYKELDNILYSNSDKKYANIMNQVFYTSFTEIYLKYGDTGISLNKNKDDFFKDGVERFVDHDLLHKLVAKMNRNCENTIYEKYQNSENVSLDKKKFFDDSLNNRIQMIREEIMVLFLERKMIPSIINCYLKEGIEYKGYDKKKFNIEIKEIIANFATNLCGDSHSWLRNFVIDHLDFIMEYNLEDLNNLAIKETSKFSNKKEIKNENKKISLEEFFENRSKLKNVLFKDYNGSINDFIIEEDTYFGTEMKKKIVYFPFDKTENNWNKKLQYVKNIFNKHKEQNIFVKSYEYMIIFNKYYNSGFYKSYDKEIRLIFIKSYLNDDLKLVVDGYYFDGNLKKEIIEETYTAKYRNYYYWSYENIEGCGNDIKKSHIEGKNKILSSYGTLPMNLSLIIDPLANKFFNIKEQKDLPEVAYYDNFYSQQIDDDLVAYDREESPKSIDNEDDIYL